jgi:nucleoside-diphosphate-sugar epimerase
LQSKTLLFLGFGDLAQRTSLLLPHLHRYAVSRSAKITQDSITFWQGAADSPEICQKMRERHLDVVVMTLTPREFTAESYRAAYVEPLQNLLAVWRQNPPGLVVFVSSTGVYHQADASWVDENSPTQPEGFSGAMLLEAETLLGSSALNHAILRFAGIYGPGRDYLLKQVRSGKGGSSEYTNRIHAQDGARFIAFLIDRHLNGGQIDNLYLVCDNEPTPGAEVRLWLAERIGVNATQLQPSASERGGNKRCLNHRLTTTGFRLQYPSFREGYQALLDTGEIG